MNWKDVPHLFANGKFRVKSYLGESGVIDGCNHKRHFLIDPPKNHWVPVQGSTLIARRVEDMTGEEEKDCLRLMEGYCGEYGNDDIALFVCQTSEGFLYALSIGVYPLDQSHFGDTVIDIKTLEESE